MCRRALRGAAVGLLWAVPAVSQSMRVVDSATSQPIERAEILIVGHATIRTSEVGVASLRFLNPGTYRLTIRRVGYESRTIVVSRSVGDTSVINAELAPLTQSLPTITTEARRDRKLEMMGFYERRKSSAAPAKAFVTAEDLERWKPALLSDVRYRTGRSLSGCTTYIDGVVASAAGGRGNTFRSGIDALVTPMQVSAMEIYRGPEVPVQYSSPGAGRRAPVCVVLIWLK
jgi:hypothetical protein